MLNLTEGSGGEGCEENCEESAGLGEGIGSGERGASGRGMESAWEVEKRGLVGVAGAGEGDGVRLEGGKARFSRGGRRRGVWWSPPVRRKRAI